MLISGSSELAFSGTGWSGPALSLAVASELFTGSSTPALSPNGATATSPSRSFLSGCSVVHDGDEQQLGVHNLTRVRALLISLGGPVGVGGGGTITGVVVVPGEQHGEQHEGADVGAGALTRLAGLGLDGAVGGGVTVALAADSTSLRSTSSSRSSPANRLAWVKDFFLAFTVSVIWGNSSGLASTVGTAFFLFSRNIMQLPGAKR